MSWRRRSRKHPESRRLPVRSFPRYPRRTRLRRRPAKASASFVVCQRSKIIRFSRPKNSNGPRSETSGPVFPPLPETDKTKASTGEGERVVRRLPEVEDHPLFAPKKLERAVTSEIPDRPEFIADHGSIAPSVLPANDDRHSVGAILRALNKKTREAP